VNRSGQVESRYDQARSDIYRRVRGFCLQEPFGRDPQECAEVLELVREYNARVQRSGSDTVAPITAETLRRIAKQAQRPGSREETGAGRREVPLVLADAAAVRPGGEREVRRAAGKWAKTGGRLGPTAELGTRPPHQGGRRAFATRTDLPSLADGCQCRKLR
jgi:hypothetical protein